MAPDDWVDGALCRESDPETWYPTRENTNSGAASARLWCGRCPVRPQCLEYVLRVEAGETAASRFGVWAGLTPRERWALELEREGARSA